LDIPNPPNEQNSNSKDSRTKEISLTFRSWNVRALCSPSKAAIINLLATDIALIQEIWTPPPDILDSITLVHSSKQRSDGYGGTLIASQQDLLKPISEPIAINEDSEIRKYSIASNRIIWLSSIYINKKSKKNLLNTFAAIQNHIPDNEWPFLILGGDWNVNLDIIAKDSVKDTLIAICKNMGLIMHNCGKTRNENAIDFFISGRNIQVKNSGCDSTPNLSDHKSIWINVSIEAPLCSLRKQKVPNKKLITQITTQTLNQSANARDFFSNLQESLKLHQRSLTKITRRAKQDHNLLNRILSLDMLNDDDLSKTINAFWTEKIEDCEHSLNNNRLKEAFTFLKKTFKFHEYKRRDGSIINKVKKNDGSLALIEDEVHELIIQNLKLTQTLDTEPQYSSPLPFPLLLPLSSKEMDKITQRFSHNKAAACDYISDTLFSPALRQLTNDKLGDLWTHLATHRHETPDNLFSTRLIPLNKCHPDVPTAKDCRPIAIQSPIIKLLEARIREKLEKYLIEKLHPGQTGFVSGLGISVNQMRIIQQINQSTSNKRHCYGLFLDFSSAYNTLLHSKLYSKLEKVLSQDEISLLKALYSRNNIKLGRHSFVPNIGVAQGSIISPSLFNIYCDDLYHLLTDTLGISIDNIMGYADDLFILCSSPSELRRTIISIKSWSRENNLLLNAKKSGVMEFTPRLGPQNCFLRHGSLFEDIPVVSSYKYLGLIITQKR